MRPAALQLRRNWATFERLVLGVSAADKVGEEVEKLILSRPFRHLSDQTCWGCFNVIWRCFRVYSVFRGSPLPYSAAFVLTMVGRLRLGGGNLPRIPQCLTISASMSSLEPREQP